jgi:hypothetical protein
MQKRKGAASYIVHLPCFSMLLHNGKARHGKQTTLVGTHSIQGNREQSFKSSKATFNHVYCGYQLRVTDETSMISEQLLLWLTDGAYYTDFQRHQVRSRGNLLSLMVRNWLSIC